MIEICVDSVAGVDAAVAGGADRIELCSALALGGLTPPQSLIQRAALVPIPVHLLARPRDGNFRYDAAEAALTADDIQMAAEAGLAGVVIGASDAAGNLDAELLAAWVAHARAQGEKRGWPLALTLHRAFDLCPDLFEALETAAELGFGRILTSGGQRCAADALDTLAELVRRACGRITILAGGGIDAANLPAILDTGVPEIHASCRSPRGDTSESEQRLAFQSEPALRTDAAKILALRRCWRDRMTLNSTNI